MLVACASDKIDGMFFALKAACIREGVDFHRGIIEPFSWRALVNWEYEMCKSVDPDELICFVDANDFLFQGTAISLEAVVRPHAILFHSESVCWPEPHKADEYPPCNTKFRYVNGTGPAGRAGAIAEAIEYGMAHFPIRGWNADMSADNDQRFWTDVYLSGRGRVDSTLELSVSLNTIERHEFIVVKDKLRIGSATPQFIHANGYSKVAYAEELRGIM